MGLHTQVIHQQLAGDDGQLYEMTRVIETALMGKGDRGQQSDLQTQGLLAWVHSLSCRLGFPTFDQEEQEVV